MQKDIIAATWKLDARTRRAKDARPEQDIRAVAKAQARAEGQDRRGGGADGRPGVRGAAPPRRPAGRDAGHRRPDAAGGRSHGPRRGELDRLQHGEALPHEEEALEPVVEGRGRDSPPAGAAAAGAGRRRRNGNRQQPDLSTLFDQELRKKQETNYETPATTEAQERPAAGRRPAGEHPRAGAAAGSAVAPAEGAGQEPGPAFRGRAEAPARAVDARSGRAEEAGRAARASSSRAARGRSSEGQKMRDVAEEMRNASKELGRQDPQQAGARGDRATAATAQPRTADAGRQSRRAAPRARRFAARSAPARRRRTPPRATNRRRPLRAPPAKTRAAGWPPNRSGSPIAPTG